jgi:hypothetical protein
MQANLQASVYASYSASPIRSLFVLSARICGSNIGNIISFDLSIFVWGFGQMHTKVLHYLLQIPYQLLGLYAWSFIYEHSNPISNGIA